VRLIATDQPVTIALGVMALVYVMALTFFARNISRSLAETWRLRFENIDLVRELSEQKLEAEQANLAKSRFLAAASHDLRQPLHALNLYVSLLEDAGDMPRVRELSHRISQSVGTLQNLFAALLDISRLQAGMLQPESEIFAIQPMLDRLSNDFAVEAAHRGLQLDISRSDAVVCTDPALLEQILRNYLSNALRYTRQGQVRLKAHRDGNAVKFEVSDTGIGIDPIQQQHIFQEFYQVKSTELDGGEGLGLGLAIVSRVARLLHLDIGVRSLPGQGSTFFVNVPAAGASSTLSEAPPARDTQAAPDCVVHLLIVDDDPGIRESTQALLESWGHRVTTAASPEDALQAAANHLPDGIIVDYRLGSGRTGIDVLHELEKHHGTRPAVVITGDVASPPMRALMASGRPWLHKPVAPAKLRAFVQSVRRDVLARKR
jgi:signal transduction histidine kinase/CheY-like chemotaxis protein